MIIISSIVMCQRHGFGMEHTLTGFAGEVADLWHRRKHLIDSDFAITAWACSIVPVVREDVKARMNGNHRDAIERVIKKIYHV